MNEENQNEMHAPDFEGEEMKMPVNADGAESANQGAQTNVINGPILFILALLLVSILGGMYYWLNVMNTPAPLPTPAPVERPTPEENNEPESTTAEAQTQALETVSTSDEIDAIESDLEATDLESLDAELEAIDAELEAALSEI